MKKLMFYVTYFFTLSIADAQYFPEMQFAELGEKGSVELTFNLNAAYPKVKDPITYYPYPYAQPQYYITSQNTVGFQFQYSINKKIGFRLHVNTDLYNQTEISIGPKVSLDKKGRITFFLPFSHSNFKNISYLDNNNGTYSSNSPGGSIQPRFLFNLPLVENNIQLNPSLGYLLFFNGDQFLSTNFSLGISINPKKWFFRIETGTSYNLAEKYRYRHWAFGVSFYL